MELDDCFFDVSSQNRVSMSELGVALKELGAVNAISLGAGLSIITVR